MNVGWVEKILIAVSIGRSTLHSREMISAEESGFGYSWQGTKDCTRSAITHFAETEVLVPF